MVNIDKAHSDRCNEKSEAEQQKHREHFQKVHIKKGKFGAERLYVGAMMRVIKLEKALGSKSTKIGMLNEKIQALQEQNGYQKALNQAASAIGVQPKTLMSMIEAES